MVSRRTGRKKYTISSNDLKHGTINYSKNRLHEHPYKTRSKSLREIETTADLIESLIPSRRSSNESVICLGSFHKSPQLVTLEDSNENFSEKVGSTEGMGHTTPKTRSHLK